MPPSHFPILLAMWIFVLPAAIFVGWMLSRRMRTIGGLWRLRITVCLLAVDALWTVGILTGWTIALPIDPVASTCFCLFVYLVSAFALWSCVLRDEPHAERRRVARILSVILIVPLLPFLLLLSAVGNLALILSVGDENSNFISAGRISETATYRMSLEPALIGGADFPVYVLYRNPRWMPLVHKKAAKGAVQCSPELTRFLPGKDSRTVNMTCAGQRTGEIALE